MLRTLWVAIVAIAVTIFSASGVIAFSLVRPKSAWVDRLIRIWARTILSAAGVSIRTENEAALEPDRHYVIIANHCSYLDIPSLQAAINQPLRFMAKKSLFSIPLFGQALQISGFVPVDRNNRKTAVRSFDMAAAQIRTGRTVVVFPEEGRSRTRDMRPFQRGAFLLALRSGLPIVPVAIRGTFEVLPVGRLSIRPGTVTVVIGEPIDTAQWSIRRREELATLMREQISAMLGTPADQVS